MTLYSPPPPLRPFRDDKPTLLVSWWITALCSVVIALRLAGRYVRVEKLFFEDKLAALFLIPLVLRAAVVHVVLLYGTNNVLIPPLLELSQDQIRRRSIGSGLVLLSRILHPAATWTLKLVSLEFFSRLVSSRRYRLTLWSMRLALLLTFLAIIVATLAECRPFSSYWTVLPTPPAQCRQGYAQLLTVSISSALTDLLLILFPVPIIASTTLKLSRKILLMLLFCLGVFNIIVGVARVPRILAEDGYQGVRTTWASVEIVVAVFVANALALGSFVRDTGAKKKRFDRAGQFSSSGPSELRSVDRGRLAVKGGVVGGRSGSEGTVVGSTTTTIGMGEEPGHMGRTKSVASRSASRDSLIPRGVGHGKQMSVEEGTGVVMKTTTIQVTVSEGDGEGGALAREDGEGRKLAPMVRPGLARAASRKGMERGSTILLQGLEPLPGRESPRGR
ncbi:hypothetical protein QBC39DRAFT_95082 [Podospora conica]|nr:hypothetical protein QBC39DRAFT_95082 [Schizothecium conicum]